MLLSNCLLIIACCSFLANTSHTVMRGIKQMTSRSGNYTRIWPWELTAPKASMTRACHSRISKGKDLTYYFLENKDKLIDLSVASCLTAHQYQYSS